MNRCLYWAESYVKFLGVCSKLLLGAQLCSALLVWTWKSQVYMTTDIGNCKIILLIFLIPNWNYYLKWETLTIYVKFECIIKELSGKQNHTIQENLKVYGRFGDIDKNEANIFKECKIQVSMCQCNQSFKNLYQCSEYTTSFK